MKIDCPCGEMIADNTDSLSYKAAIVADQDGDDLRESLDRHEDPWVAMRRHTAASMYQCSDCNRLAILREGHVYWFAPESPTPPLLYSARGSQWPRHVIGHWRNGKGELSWDRSGAPGDDDGAFLTDFSSWEELRELYDHTFRRLLAAGLLRASLLKNGDEVVHRWPAGEPA